MAPQTSRTWLCSVVFLDIVGYSKRTVADQLTVKEDLSGLIRHALRGVREEDVIILDSGDGAAVCFLADPVEALFFGLGLHSSLALGSTRRSPEYACRIGINLGPVKVIRDVNGRRNTVGDGINSAQRVMDFAEPNQLLVSRSFHDVVACLSEEYNSLFSYIGIRHDKHVKEYDIYEVTAPAAELARPEEPPEDETGGHRPAVRPVWDDGVLDQATRALAERIGPLAKVLVQRAAKRACSPADLYEMLAQHLPDSHLRELFIHAMSGKGEPSPPAAGESRATAAVASAAGGAAAGPAAGNPFEVPAAAYEPLRHRLAANQGPFAKVLIKRAALKAADYGEFCRLLAEELPGDQRADFIAFAMKLNEA